jgi:serine O-acetyltransferase
MMSSDMSDLKSDLARYPQKAWLREQSIWAIAVYRFGCWNDARQGGFCHWLCDRVYWALFRLAETITGISITKATRIGGGLRIHHFGNIVVHPEARIGNCCTIRHGCTIGHRRAGGPLPVIGDDVELGAYAQVLGGIKVGNGATIGALSLVIEDVPAGATAVGIPARIIATANEERCDD